MRRVPVMMTDTYLMDLFYDYPVLWVHDYADVTGDLLKDKLPASYERACNAASAESFTHVMDTQVINN